LLRNPHSPVSEWVGGIIPESWAACSGIRILLLAASLVWRFLKTGGPEMLRMMKRPAETGHAH
jgi:hypothetical protein